jgi:hypothetical protein
MIKFEDSLHQKVCCSQSGEFVRCYTDTANIGLVPTPPPPLETFDDSDEDEDDESNHCRNGSIFEFGSSLTVKGATPSFLIQLDSNTDTSTLQYVEGGILTVADDFLKNDGRKFLDLMEQLAERKIRLLEEEDGSNGNGGNGGQGDWEDTYDEEDDEEYEDEEVSLRFPH